MNPELTVVEFLGAISMFWLAIVALFILTIWIASKIK